MRDPAPAGRRVAAWLLGEAAPLLAGLAAVVLALLDLFDLVALPSGVDVKSVVILAAGFLLLVNFRTQVENDRVQKKQEHVLRWVDDNEPAVRQLDATDIRNALNVNLDRSKVKEFYFRGGSGRWLRSATLPALSNVADRDVPIAVQLLDPRDEHLCRAYASYRAKSRAPSALRPGEDDPRQIQADLLASAYVTSWYAARSRLVARIIFLRSFSPLRYDVSSEGAILTISDPAAPALQAAPGSWLHTSLVDELKQAEHGSAVLRLNQTTNVFPATLSAVTAADVQAALMLTDLQEYDGTTSPLLQAYAAAADIDWDRVARACRPG